MTMPPGYKFSDRYYRRRATGLLLVFLSFILMQNKNLSFFGILLLFGVIGFSLILAREWRNELDDAWDDWKKK